MKYQIHDLEFKTKTAVLDYFKKLKANVPVGHIFHKHTDEYKRLLALLSMHTHAAKKMKGGIKHFTTGITFYNQIDFRLVREDDSMEVFSYIKCISPPPHKQEVIGAMRRLIESQIIDFRTNFFADFPYKKCPYGGCYISADNCHVHHRHPKSFLMIVESFLSDNNMTYDDVVLAHGDWKLRSLADKKLADDFYNYHAIHADLECISIRANLSMGGYKAS